MSHALRGQVPDHQDARPATRAEKLGLVVYGTIAVLASIGGLSLETSALDARAAGGVVAVATISVWLAHTMSQMVGDGARRTAPREIPRRLRQLARTWPVLAAALPPLAVLATASAAGASIAVALELAETTGVLMLAAVGAATARRSHLGWVDGLVHLAILTVVGLAIVTLEVAAHHA
jgi:hypothetical protein